MEMNMEINIMEAKGPENVRKIFPTKAYAKVSINSNSKSKQKTEADKHGKTNPAWNTVLDFPVPESNVQEHGSTLVIKLYCKRTLGDRYIGEVHESIKELYERAEAEGGSVVLTCPVKRGCVESQGELKFSCRFGDKRTTDEQPSLADGKAVGTGRILQVGTLLFTAGGQIVNLLYD